MKPAYTDLGMGITCIETHYQRPGLASCYLLLRGEAAALIDTGTAHTVPSIMALLGLLGVRPEQIKYVIPTHVHLDHAGGAGQLMQQLPEAQLVVHPQGARHLIDPAKLAAGASAVYGKEKFAQDFGELEPVSESRVIEAQDGLIIELNGRKLRCLDTPGHARHHLCLWDEESRGFFTGDTFGLAYKELYTEKGPFLMLPSTPVQFDPDAWHRTLDQLMEYRPERMYLTHYCGLENPMDVVGVLHQEIDAYVELALAAAPSERDTAIRISLRNFYLDRLRAHGCRLSEQEIDRLLEMDIELCAQGLLVWLNRREKEPRKANS